MHSSSHQLVKTALHLSRRGIHRALSSRSHVTPRCAAPGVEEVSTSMYEDTYVVAPTDKRWSEVEE
jgi:hypothetical protein